MSVAFEFCERRKTGGDQPVNFTLATHITIPRCPGIGAHSCSDSIRMSLILVASPISFSSIRPCWPGRPAIPLKQRKSVQRSDESLLRHLQTLITCSHEIPASFTVAFYHWRPTERSRNLVQRAETSGEDSLILRAMEDIPLEKPRRIPVHRTISLPLLKLVSNLFLCECEGCELRCYPPLPDHSMPAVMLPVLRQNPKLKIDGHHVVDNAFVVWRDVLDVKPAPRHALELTFADELVFCSRSVLLLNLETITWKQACQSMLSIGFNISPTVLDLYLGREVPLAAARTKTYPPAVPSHWKLPSADRTSDDFAQMALYDELLPAHRQSHKLSDRWLMGDEQWESERRSMMPPSLFKLQEFMEDLPMPAATPQMHLRKLAQMPLLHERTARRICERPRAAAAHRANYCATSTLLHDAPPYYAPACPLFIGRQQVPAELCWIKPSAVTTAEESLVDDLVELAISAGKQKDIAAASSSTVPSELANVPSSPQQQTMTTTPQADEPPRNAPPSPSSFPGQMNVTATVAVVELNFTVAEHVDEPATNAVLASTAAVEDERREEMVRKEKEEEDDILRGPTVTMSEAASHFTMDNDLESAVDGYLQLHAAGIPFAQSSSSTSLPTEDKQQRSGFDTVVCAAIKAPAASKRKLLCSDLTVLVSELFMETYPAVITALAADHQTQCIDCPLIGNVDFIVDATTCVFVVFEGQHAMKMKSLTDSVLKYNAIWIIFCSFDSSSASTVHRQQVEICRDRVRVPVKVGVRFCDAEVTALSDCIAHCIHQSSRATLVRSSWDIPRFKQRPYLQAIQQADKTVARQCFMLQRLPSINFFLAAQLLACWPFRQLMHQKEQDIINRLARWNPQETALTVNIRRMMAVLKVHSGLVMMV